METDIIDWNFRDVVLRFGILP